LLSVRTRARTFEAIQHYKMLHVMRTRYPSRVHTLASRWGLHVTERLIPYSSKVEAGKLRTFNAKPCLIAEGVEVLASLLDEVRKRIPRDLDE